MRKMLVNSGYKLMRWLDADSVIYQNRTTGAMLVFHIGTGYAEPYAA